MAETAAPPRPAEHLDRAGCEEDFVLWTRHQAALNRAGRFDLIDWENVAEEIESLGIGDRRELGSRLEVLTMYLLTWQFQPMHRSRSWRSTIRNQRGRIERVLKQSPSLHPEVAELAVRNTPRRARRHPPRRVLRSARSRSRYPTRPHRS